MSSRKIDVPRTAKVTQRRLDPTLLSETEMSALLNSGEQQPALTAYFGADEYQELRLLAKLAASRKKGRRGTVYVLPGIMGSKLASCSDPHQPLWLNPTAVEHSELTTLALPSPRRLIASGVILGGYMKLWLTLQVAGFTPRLHPYDWRQSIVRSGRQLADRIAHDRSKQIMIVAHSMGGLVARAALPHVPRKKVRMVVQLGAPNRGSFAPVQAFRAVYPTVRKLATLDRKHSAEDLARCVFSTLPGLYQLLPHCPDESFNYFDINAWPNDSLAPKIEHLQEAQKSRQAFANADERCYLIAGVGQPTVTRIVKRAELEYVFANDGDGTVPLTLALWPGAHTRFVHEAHGALTKNNAVCNAIVDLLTRGHTDGLLGSWSPSDTVIKQVNESDLRSELLGKVRWNDLPPEERRKILEPTISEEFRRLAMATSGS
jgi:pimeloyl-ACP methyl ester carboxylesterase